jgi:hypothetical protein
MFTSTMPMPRMSKTPKNARLIAGALLLFYIIYSYLIGDPKSTYYNALRTLLNHNLL